MANYGDANTVTGQAFRVEAKQTIVSALPAALIDHALLSDIGSVVNLKILSGKQKGAVFITHDVSTSKYYVAVATGSLPEDKWQVVELDTAITPA